MMFFILIGVINLLSRIVLWAMLIIPWLTLFILKKEKVKHYMPVGILASFLMALYNVVAFNQKHWTIKVVLIPWLKPLFVPGVLGLFLITTIWVFYFTYPHLWLYFITNIVVDFMFAFFPVHYILQNKLMIYELVNIAPWGRFLIFISFSIVLFCYQKWQDSALKPI
jgi:hypothetical protein